MTQTQQTSDYLTAVERSGNAQSAPDGHCLGTPPCRIESTGDAVPTAALVTDLIDSRDVNRRGRVDVEDETPNPRTVCLRGLERWLQAVAHCTRTDVEMRLARSHNTLPKVMLPVIVT